MLTVEAMGLNYYASSSVLLPHQASSPHHLMDSAHHEHAGGAILSPEPAAFQVQQSSFTDNAVRKRPVSKFPRPPSLNYLSRTPLAAAGRKRSREDIGDDLNPQQVEPKPEPVYGPGMTLIYPDNAPLNVSAESQSGTWMEEYHEEPSTSSDRPVLVARKSQRRVVDAPVPTDAHNNIDPVVLKLGIGWRQPSSDAQRTALAGAEKFVSKQFDLIAPAVRFQHEGLGIYVVSSEPAGARGYWHQWWLFRDDLKSCRFLCNNEQDLFRRLGNKRQDERGNWIPDILVEGPEVFARDVPPSPVAALSPSNGVACAANVEAMQLQLQMQQQIVNPLLAQQPQQPQQVPVADGDVEMEM